VLILGVGMQGLNGEKRKRNDDRVVEKSREVIQVRTKKAE